MRNICLERVQLRLQFLDLVSRIEFCDCVGVFSGRDGEAELLGDHDQHPVIAGHFYQGEPSRGRHLVVDRRFRCVFVQAVPCDLATELVAPGQYFFPVQPRIRRSAECFTDCLAEPDANRCAARDSLFEALDRDRAVLMEERKISGLLCALSLRH